MRRFDATVTADEGTPRRVDVTVATTSADMGNDDVNRAIQGPDWLDGQRFPVAEFVATEVQRSAPGSYVAIGTLKMKGLARPLRVPFAWAATDGEATMTGDLVIDRGFFGIGLGEWRSTSQVAGDVKVRFVVHLRRGP